ncbi:N-methyl-L-tryptophan oxidase [Amnibacterium sp.]|uniref:N-methyl-L-tryptophan oxidase n=1 Tax=Amnibacterium sp. TaxID=1872496 RepID=UPI00260A4F5C|nr:N-methyl-L-tryptophan oxidase [Amnibacterium sp.]MCU1473320.1 N-methyl-L-tryptophan oxidase [Amnibacterium sp.]
MVEEVEVDGTVVVGLGGIGAAAALALADRGETVVGLDPRPAGHAEGSSHGHTRLVRLAYFEDPAYVPMTVRAWRLWQELERRSGEHLLTACGVLALAPTGDPARLVPATIEAAHRYGLQVDRLGAAAIRERYPAVTVPNDWEGALEREAGFVDPEATVRTLHRLAREAGADLRAETALAIEYGERPVVVTGGTRYHPRRVVITAGPWAPELLGERLPLTVTRKVVAHFSPLDPDGLGPDRLPGFVAGAGGALHYGFPLLPGDGVKIARHDGGAPTTPASVDRTVHPEEVDALRAALARLIPSAAGDLLTAYTCLYTMSPDGDFLLGPLPWAPSCIVATGCSGHAFKFVPLLGEVLADLALGTRPPVDIDFLSPARFA